MLVSILSVCFVHYNIWFWKPKEWLTTPTESLPFNFYRGNFYRNFQIILILLDIAAAV